MTTEHSAADEQLVGADDPRRGHALERLGRGFGYLGRGFRFVSEHPQLIKYCVAPLLINVLVTAVVVLLFYTYHDAIVNWLWARPTSWLLRLVWYVFYVFILLGLVVLSYVAFFVMQAALSAPFNDLLSEYVEELAFGRPPPPFSMARLMRNLGVTILHELTKLGIYLAVMLPLLVFSVTIPVLGPLALAVLGFYLTARFVAYNYWDYALARRRYSFRRKWVALGENRALSLGFGSALALSLLVPLIGLVCVPMAAVGGTLLVCDLERVGALGRETL